VAGHFEGRKDF